MASNTQNSHEAYKTQIKYGKEKFDSSETKEDKKEGYDSFVNGLELLNKIRKDTNQNEYAKNLVEDVFKKHYADAQIMQQQLKSMP